MTDILEMPKEIQNWIDRDTSILRNGSSSEIQNFLKMFRDPQRDSIYWYDQAIQEVIQELNL